MGLEEVAKLKQELDVTPYKDLSEKFTELGISEIWKAGVKKDTLIQLALQRLEEIKAFEVEEEVEVEEEEETIIEDEVEVQKGVTIDEEVEIVPTEIEVAKKAIVENYSGLDEDQKEELEAARNLFDGEVSEDAIPVRPIYSREVIEENLELILSNLSQATPLQKALLFTKQTELMLMQEQHDACDLLEK